MYPSQEQFIGRGERLVKKLLTNPFGVKNILTQVPIRALVKPEVFEFYDPEIQKHKFDLVIYTKDQVIAVEVNYHHGDKADRKSNRIFEPDLKDNGVKLLRIDDDDCDFIFKENGRGVHITTTDDIREILNAFDKAGISI